MTAAIISLPPAAPPGFDEARARQWRAIATTRPRAWWSSERLAALEEHLLALERCRFVRSEERRLVPDQNPLLLSGDDFERWLHLVDLLELLTDQVDRTGDRALS